jgi:lanosterol synthase
MLAPAARAGREDLCDAARFLLERQSSDGGFCGYEAERTGFSLDWLDALELPGSSAVDRFGVERTASCVAALAMFRERFPTAMPDELARAIERGGDRIRALQNPDGSWEGSSGVNYIYGTMFGVRGLLAAGAPPQDPAIRRAAGFLLARQRNDGGWSEKKDPSKREYLEGKESQVVQTAWALSTLLLADDPTWDAIERAASHLAAQQLENGEWPKQDPIGIFFHSALIDHVLYKSYFPVWALAHYERRRAERSDLVDSAARPAVQG